MSFAGRVSDLATRIATEFKTVRTMTGGTQAYQPGWADFAADWTTTARRAANGMVTLKIGLMKSGAIAANDWAITLPVGFRPVGKEATIVALYSGTDGWGGYAHISIGTDGKLTVPYLSKAGTVLFGSIDFAAA